MSLCAILYGEPAHHERTLSSMANAENLTIVCCSRFSEMNFDTLSDDYTFFIKSGDVLSEDAVQHLRLNIAFSLPDILYSDEKMLCSTSTRELVFCKPDYSPAMILSMNYFHNLLCIKTSLLQNISRIESTSDENFLYEIVLKVLPMSRTIVHINKVLYARYVEKNEVNYQDFFVGFDQGAGKYLLEKHCQNNAIAAEVVDGRYHGTYRVKYAIQGEPLISIIIPFRDQSKLLEACIHSILEKSTYKNFEIIGINNGSSETQTLDLMQSLQDKDKRIRFFNLDIPFNYSTLNNHAANYFARGEHILFLNNDTEVIAPDWIEAMLEHSQCSDIGIVGAKLLYADHSIQHCGMVFDRQVEHIFRQLPDTEPGYFYYPHIVRNYHIVTFACVMIKSMLFKQVGGLCEKLEIECNDVDICARVSALGYYNVYTPYAVLYHYECKSRGKNDTPEKKIRGEWEWMTTRQRTPAVFVRDSFRDQSLMNQDLRELRDIQASLSWRVTRPLREILKWLRKL